MRRLIVVLVLMAAVAVPAWAGELAGVKVPDTVTVDGAKLVLNGMGLRKKLFIKVYLGALYLPEKSSDAAAIIAADEPKQMLMHFIYKEVDKGKLNEAWEEGFEANSAAEMAALKDRLDTFMSWWSDMRKGDEAVMTYVPGTGTTVTIKGEDKGVIEGLDFARALFAVWLGEKPADKGLKEGMLGE